MRIPGLEPGTLSQLSRISQNSLIINSNVDHTIQEMTIISKKKTEKRSEEHDCECIIVKVNRHISISTLTKLSTSKQGIEIITIKKVLAETRDYPELM